MDQSKLIDRLAELLLSMKEGRELCQQKLEQIERQLQELMSSDTEDGMPDVLQPGHPVLVRKQGDGKNVYLDGEILMAIPMQTEGCYQYVVSHADQTQATYEAVDVKSYSWWALAEWMFPDDSVSVEWEQELKYRRLSATELPLDKWLMWRYAMANHIIGVLTAGIDTKRLPPPLSNLLQLYCPENETVIPVSIETSSPSSPQSSRPKIGEVLVGQGMEPKAIEAGLKHAQAKNMRLGEALIALEMCEESAIYEALAIQFEMEYVELDFDHYDQEILDLMGIDLINKHSVFPLGMRDDKLWIAISDPTDTETLDVLKFALNVDLEPVVVLPSELKKHIENVNSLPEPEDEI